MTTTADVSVRTRSLQKVGLHVLDTEGEGPLTKEKALVMEGGLRGNREAFFDQFTKDFFSSAGAVAVREQQRNDALMMCRQSDQGAALQCMKSFGTEDFRRDLETITVPTLVLHRDSDAVVPFEGSRARTHLAVTQSTCVVIPGALHGCNVSHAEQFNSALLSFSQA